MCAKLSFDASKVAPAKPMDPVPKGWYQVKIFESDVAPAKTDPTGGTRLALGVEIITGEYAGRKAWDGINIKNKNPKAQEIGQEQLSALCHATGCIKMSATEELHDKPFEIKLGLEEDRSETNAAGKTVSYDARNVFKGFRPIEGAAPASAGTPTAAAAPAWAKGKAAPGKPVAPVKPAPAPAPEPEPEPQGDEAPGGVQAERTFFYVVEDETKEATGAEIATMLGQGMPEDTPVMAQDEPEGAAWQTAAHYEIAPWSPPAAPAKKSPPAKPAPKAAPTKPAAPSAPAAKGTPPWLKGK